MPDKRTYTIRRNRLEKAALTGMELTKEGILVCAPDVSRRSLFLGALDGGEEGAEWGRIYFEGEFTENMVFVTHILASDNREAEPYFLDMQILPADKKTMFEQAGELKWINRKDMLLYELKGRYLWIFLEITGEGEGYIRQIKVNSHGDNFMAAFPEIYQERGGFFHRYLSVFSSLYNDFQQEIDCAALKLDIDTAPAGLLPLFADWLGLDIGGNFLEESKLRLLLKETYRLCRYKGTKYALLRLVQIVSGEEPVIIERNDVCFHADEDNEIYKELYGKSGSDITLLIYKQADEEERSYLMFLLNQFKPVRSRLKLVFLKQEGILDYYCYLDRNAGISVLRGGIADGGRHLDGTIFLQ